MKNLKLFPILIVSFIALSITSCRNQDIDFPNFDYTTVYFAYQYPVRTIVLGEDIYDTSLDNEHKCEIYATMGGVYSNNKQVDIDFTVDNSLCNNLFFSTNAPVTAMPSTHYSLGAGKISLKNALQGSVLVQLTDAFFSDPKSISNTYVIPLRMTKVVNADSILSGTPKVQNPIKTRTSDWDVQPKDFVLYCVKFINQWHANYLRRGVDMITQDGTTTTKVRHAQFVENNEVIGLKTLSLKAVEYTVNIVNAVGENTPCKLLLTFDGNNKCTVSSSTTGFEVTGTGTFIEKGEKNSWGNKDRNALYLDYNISMTGRSYSTKDTLVVRDRGVKLETFKPNYNVN